MLQLHWEARVAGTLDFVRFGALFVSRQTLKIRVTLKHLEFSELPGASSESPGTHQNLPAAPGSLLACDVHNLFLLNEQLRALLHVLTIILKIIRIAAESLRATLSGIWTI